MTFDRHKENVALIWTKGKKLNFLELLVVWDSICLIIKTRKVFQQGLVEAAAAVEGAVAGERDEENEGG